MAQKVAEVSNIVRAEKIYLSSPYPRIQGNTYELNTKISSSMYSVLELRSSTIFTICDYVYIVYIVRKVLEIRKLIVQKKLTGGIEPLILYFLIEW